jgi:hypothetical protein
LPDIADLAQIARIGQGIDRDSYWCETGFVEEIGLDMATKAPGQL